MRAAQKEYMKNFLVNAQFSLTVAAHTKVPDNWRDLNYIPDFNRFYFIQDGEGWLKIGDEEFYPKKGQLFVLPAGVLQSYSTINQNTFTKYWCHFTATIGDFNIFQLLKFPHYIHVSDIPLVEYQFEKLIRYFQLEDVTSVLRAKAALIELVCYFIEHAEVEELPQTASSSIEKVNIVLKYIEKNIAQDISVENLAKLVHFHPNYFIRFFKSMLGTSPIHYINKLRMEKAKQLLLTTDLTISEIADQIGMQLYYFSRIFKNHNGFSPSEFRQAVKKEDRLSL